MALRLALWMVLSIPSVASSATFLLEWEHESDDLVTVAVMADGTTIAELPHPARDLDGRYRAHVPVPTGVPITILVVDSEATSSPASNAQTYGDECGDWDADGDGVVGLADFGTFLVDFQMGMATLEDFGAFRQFLGCRP